MSSENEFTAEEIAEEVSGLYDSFWNNRSGNPDIPFGTSEIEWLNTHAPGTLQTWETEWDERHRKPTRQEIIQKMNHRMEGTGQWVTDFDNGLRQTLATAITLPEDTDYEVYFNLYKMFDLFWYFRADRNANPLSRPSAQRIEEQYPEETQQDRSWGERSGEIAAVRWLANEDRQNAEEWFPELDS